MDSDLDDTILKAKIIQFANQTPERFLSLTSDMDQEYRVFLKKAFNKKVLTNVNGVWKHGSINIGLSDDQAIVWLKENADLYAMLRHQVRTGQPAKIKKEEPVVEELVTETQSEPQTISSSTINKLEQEPTKPKGWFTKKK